MLKDFRYAWRILRRSPGFTAVAVVSVGLGIGANTTTFSVLDAILLRPPAYRDPERLIVVQRVNQQRGIAEQLSAPDLRDLSERSRTLEAIGAYRSGTVTVGGVDEPERMRVSAISANLPDVLGVAPLIGRQFTSDDMQPEAPLPILIGESLWRERFAGRADVLNASLIFDGATARIAGVMPESFAFPNPSTRLWVPLRIAPAARRNVYSLRTVARLKPGVSLDAARQDLAAQMAQIAREHPDTSTGVGATALSLREHLAGDSRGLLLVSAGAVAFILLIVCANLAGLLLARASTRASEFAVRSALGAGRPQLLRQLLAEGMLLSGIGGAVGLLASSWGVDALRIILKDRFIRAPEIHLNGTVLLFALGATALCGIAFGMAPVVTALRSSLAPAFLRGPRGGGTSMRALLIAAEVAIAFVLLAGAGLMAQTLWRLRHVDPGFSAGGTLAVTLSPNLAQFRSVEQIAAFYEDILASIRAIPGVIAAGAVGHVPLTGDRAGTGIMIEHRPTKPGEGIDANYQLAGPQYFAAMRIPFLEGRDFNASDVRGAPEVIIINRTLADLCWPGQSALGRRLRLGPNPNVPWATVVGVIANVRHDQLSLPSRPEAYESYFQHGSGTMSLIVQQQAGADLAGAIRSQVRRTDKNLPIPAIVSMDEIVSISLRDRSFLMWILVGFAACATALAAVGIYGVIAYSVAQRTREIGIRMALGARSGDVTRMILRGGIRMAVVGVIAGGLAAAGLTRLLQTLLFGVKPGDPMTLISAAGLLVSVAIAACLLPTIRAARIPVSTALRHE